jgi:hypothetical protein
MGNDTVSEWSENYFRKTTTATRKIHSPGGSQGSALPLTALVVELAELSVFLDAGRDLLGGERRLGVGIEEAHARPGHAAGRHPRLRLHDMTDDECS